MSRFASFFFLCKKKKLLHPYEKRVEFSFLSKQGRKETINLFGMRTVFSQASVSSLGKGGGIGDILFIKLFEWIKLSCLRFASFFFLYKKRNSYIPTKKGLSFLISPLKGRHKRKKMA